MGAASSCGAPVAHGEVEGDLNPFVFETLWRRYGDTFTFNRAGRLSIFFSHPEDVSAVLTTFSKDFVKGEQEQALAAAVGWGLLTHEGEKHKQIQSSLRPSVRGEILDKYLARSSRLAVDRISKLRGQELPLVSVSREFSQDVTEVNLFGLSEPTRAYEYHQAVWENNHYMQSQIVSSSDESRPREQRDAFRKNKAIADQHVNALIRTWQESGKPKGNFLEYLFAHRDLLAESSEPIREEASIFLQAGTETTASLISWIICCLSANPSYWAPLSDEIEAVELYSHDSFRALPLLKAVAKETLRLFPPIWLIPRVAVRDVRIGRTEVPAGARVNLSPWVTQRHPDFFYSSEEFRPERWLLNGGPSHRAAYFPFGLGSRICIGEAFGMTTAMTFIYELVRHGAQVEIGDNNLRPKNTSLISYPDERILSRWS